MMAVAPRVRLLGPMDPGEGHLVRCPGRHPGERHGPCEGVLLRVVRGGEVTVRCQRCKAFVAITDREST